MHIDTLTHTCTQVHTCIPVRMYTTAHTYYAYTHALTNHTHARTHARTHTKHTRTHNYNTHILTQSDMRAFLEATTSDLDTSIRGDVAGAKPELVSRLVN